MATIICPECGNQVSDKSKNCIKCGFPIYFFLEKLETEKQQREEKARLKAAEEATILIEESIIKKEAEKEKETLHAEILRAQLEEHRKNNEITEQICIKHAQIKKESEALEQAVIEATQKERNLKKLIDSQKAELDVRIAEITALKSDTLHLMTAFEVQSTEEEQLAKTLYDQLLSLQKSLSEKERQIASTINDINDSKQQNEQKVSLLLQKNESHFEKTKQIILANESLAQKVTLLEAEISKLPLDKLNAIISESDKISKLVRKNRKENVLSHSRIFYFVWCEIAVMLIVVCAFAYVLFNTNQKYQAETDKMRNTLSNLSYELESINIPNLSESVTQNTPASAEKSETSNESVSVTDVPENAPTLTRERTVFSDEDLSDIASRATIRKHSPTTYFIEIDLFDEESDAICELIPYFKREYPDSKYVFHPRLYVTENQTTIHRDVINSSLFSQQDYYQIEIVVRRNPYDESFIWTLQKGNTVTNDFDPNITFSEGGIEDYFAPDSKCITGKTLCAAEYNSRIANVKFKSVNLESKSVNLDTYFKVGTDEYLYLFKPTNDYKIGLANSINYTDYTFVGAKIADMEFVICNHQKEYK